VPIHLDVLTYMDERSAFQAAEMIARTFEGAGEKAGEALTENITKKLQQANVSQEVIKQFQGLEKDVQSIGLAIGSALVSGIAVGAAGLTKIGDIFENINRQLVLTTDTSAAGFDNLKNRADALVGTLDTSIGKVGTDMGVLATRLRDTGPALDPLVHNVEMLRDRFGDLNIGALSGAFVEFGVRGAAQANEALASLAKSAVDLAGGNLQSLITQVANGSDVFTQAGLNIAQAGHLIGELSFHGVDGAKAVTGLEVAMKAMDDAMKNGRGNWKDFNQFIIDISNNYQRLMAGGDIAGAQRLIEETTGQRRWADAIVLFNELQETMANPRGYQAEANYLKDLEEKSKTMKNAFHELKNQLIVTLEPIAVKWVDDLVEKVKELGRWAQAHQDDLKKLFDGVAQIAGGVLDALKTMTELLGKHPELIKDVVYAFVAWESIQGLASVINALRTIETVLKAIPGEAAVAGGALSAMGSGGVGPGGFAGRQGPPTIIGPGLGTLPLFFPGAMPDVTQLSDQDYVNQINQLRAGHGQPPLQPGQDIPGLPGHKVPAPGAPGAPSAPSPPAASGAFGDPNRGDWWRTGMKPGFQQLPGGTGAILDPDYMSKLPGGRKGKLPEAPEVPYGAGYGEPPLPGETEAHYRTRMELLEKQHALAQDQARLLQLEQTNTATAEDIQKVKNKIAKDEVELNEAEMKALNKHAGDMEQIGAKIDKDFGISKGLSGIAENLFKFLADLAAAPLLGMLGAVSQAGGAAKGEGLIGLGLAGMGISKEGFGGGGYSGFGGFPGGGAPGGLPGGPGGGGGPGGLPGGPGVPGGPGGGAPPGASPAAPFVSAFGGRGGSFNPREGPLPQQPWTGENIGPGGPRSPLDMLLHPPAQAAPSGFPGFPGMGTGTADSNLIAALTAAGIPSNMFPLLIGFARTEGNNPSGVPTLGFTDSQAGTTLAGHAAALSAQIRNRQSVAGPFPAGGTPQQQASWMATVVGQAGVASDWQGNRQPPRDAYVGSIVSGMPHMDSGGAVPIIAHSGEHVLTANDVNAMGGQAGVYAFRAALQTGDIPDIPWPYDPGKGAMPNDPWPYVPNRPLPPSSQWNPGSIQRYDDGGAVQPKPPPPPPGAPDSKIVGPLPVPGAPGAAPGGPQLPAGTPATPGPPQPSPVGGLAPWAGDPQGGKLGISQGGLLGGAIQAGIQAAMGSGGMSFGAGAAAGVAAQIAMQEINRAIAYGGQVAGIAVQGLQQTFKLSDSQLAQSGWVTRIAGGLAGAAPVLANMAGQLGGSGQGTGLPQGVSGLPGAPGGLTPLNLTATGAPGTVNGDVHNGTHIDVFNHYGPPDTVGPTLDSLDAQNQTANLGAGMR